MKINISYQKLEQAAFFASMLLALLPILLAGQYFVTGDGPCHSYNASVLLDWVNGDHVDYYRHFYTLNPYFEPNWWTHAWLVLLQMLFSPAFAEKVFLTAYVLAFGFGIRYLLRQINPSAIFLSSAGMLFCWHHLLQMGFFNYAWSLAGMFWMLGYWLNAQLKFGYRQGFVLAFGWVALYSMHPVGLSFCALGVALSIFSEGLLDVRNLGIKKALERLWRSILRCGITALPALILAANYLARGNWPKGANTESFSGILDAWATLTMLININKSEHVPVNFVVMFMAVIVLAAAVIRTRSWKWQSADFLLLFIGASLLAYFSQAGTQSLELLMPLRLQLLSWFGFLLWAATASFNKQWRMVVPLVSFVLLLILVTDRLPAHSAASKLVADWTTIAPTIKEESVLMVLNYDFSGRNAQGNVIGDRTWMFIHAADYIGAARSGIIMSDNYEALMQYFPIRWRPEANLYHNTTIDGFGFEDRPPRVDLLNFPKRSQGRQINYVLVLGQTAEDQEQEQGKALSAQLEAAYDKVATSPLGSAVLYQLRE